MTTAHFIMQVIAFITLGLSSMFWMFVKVTFTGPAAILIKPLIRLMGFLGAVWLILEILKVQY
jgi:hypothetical protein